MMNFIKPDLVSMATDVTKVDYKFPSNHKCFEEISVGQQTTRYLISIEDQCDPAAISSFYSWIYCCCRQAP